MRGCLLNHYQHNLALSRDLELDSRVGKSARNKITMSMNSDCKGKRVKNMISVYSTSQPVLPRTF